MSIFNIVQIIAGITAAYFIGTISIATIIAKTKGVDIRTQGSGNPGGTNVMRVLGVGMGLLVMLLDIAKGVLGTLACVLLMKGVDFPVFLGLTDWAKALGMVFVVAGHNWPVTMKFKGGKGVATTLGSMLVMWAVPALFATGTQILMLILFRRMGLSSMLGAAAAIIFALILKNPVAVTRLDFIIVSSVLFIMIIIRHKSNIQRMLQGTEPPLWRTKKEKLRLGLPIKEPKK